MIKILNLKLVILLEYQNIKSFFAKFYIPNWSEKVYVIKKFKNTVQSSYAISDFKGKKIVWRFYEKELQKTGQNKFRDEKVIKTKIR